MTENTETWGMGTYRFCRESEENSLGTRRVREVISLLAKGDLPAADEASEVGERDGGWHFLVEMQKLYQWSPWHLPVRGVDRDTACVYISLERILRLTVESCGPDSLTESVATVTFRS